MVYLCVLHSMSLTWLIKYFLISYRRKEGYSSPVIYLSYFLLIFLLFSLYCSISFYQAQEDRKGLAVGEPVVKPVAVSASTGLSSHPIECICLRGLDGDSCLINHISRAWGLRQNESENLIFHFNSGDNLWIPLFTILIQPLLFPPTPCL